MCFLSKGERERERKVRGPRRSEKGERERKWRTRGERRACAGEGGNKEKAEGGRGTERGGVGGGGGGRDVGFKKNEITDWVAANWPTSNQSAAGWLACCAMCTRRVALASESSSSTL